MKHNIDSNQYKKTTEYINYLKIQLMDMTVKRDNCLIWKGYVFADGYGGYSTKRVHRLIYELFIGPIPEKMFVCHKCDVPLCVNPSHLFLGTNKDNMSDMKYKKRSLSGKLNPATREDVKKKLRKDWTCINPQGIVFETSNLKLFCETNNLKYRSMMEAGGGKGWKCKRVN